MGNMDIIEEIRCVLLDPYTKRQRTILAVGSVVLMTPVLLLCGLSVPAFSIGTAGYHTGMYYLINYLNKR